MKKLILGLILITSQLFATNYYIDPAHPSASNANAGTAPGLPWADQEAIHNNWTNFTGGDVIFIAEGTRLEPSGLTRQGVIMPPTGYTNGSRYNKIKFTSYIGYGGAGAKPVVSNKNSYPATYCQPLFIRGGAYLEFENLRFESAYGEGVYLKPTETGFGNGAVGVHDMIWRNCEFETGNLKVYRYIQGLSGVVQGSPTYVPDMDLQNANTSPVYRLWVIDCIFESTRSEDAISLPMGIRGRSDGSGLVAAADTNIFVHGCTFYDTQEEALDIAGGSDHLIEYNRVTGTFGSAANGMKFHSQCAPFEYSTIRYNTFAGIWYTNPAFYPWAGWSGTVGSSAFGLVLWNTQNCEVYNNTMYNRHAFELGDDERTDQTAYFSTCQDNVVKNNIFYGTYNIHGTGNVIHGSYTNEIVDSLTYYNTMSNNLFYDNSQFYDYRTLRCWRYNPAIGKMDVIDELCVYSDDNSVGGLLGSWTDIWLNGKYNQAGKGDLNTDPLFVSPTWTGSYLSYDHSLQSGSPCIDAGTNYSSVLFPEEAVDIAGNTRISGTAPDMGAYEYQSGPTPAQLTFYVGTTSINTSYNMGTVATSESKSFTLTINNIGTSDPVNISAITLTGDSASLFTIDDIYVVSGGISATVVPPYDLEAGSTMYVDVSFDGSATVGAKQCGLSINHDSNVMANDPHVITLTTTVSDASVIFAISGDSTKIFTSALGSEVLQNYAFTNWTADDPDDWTVFGDDGLPASGDRVTETNPGVANIISTAGDYVAVKQYSVTDGSSNYLLEIDLDAVTTGGARVENGGIVKSWSTPQTDKFWFTSDGSSITLMRNSSGGANNFECNFLSIKKITSSWDASATITNTGAGDLTCDSIKFVDGTDFVLNSATTFIVGTEEEYILSYSFTPTDTGYFYDTLRIFGVNASNVSGGIYDVVVEGYLASGYSPTAPQIDFEYNDVYFPDTDTAAVSDTTLEISNPGSATLTIDSIKISTDQFTLNFPDGDGDTTLAAGGTFDVDYSFTPTTVGVKTAIMYIYFAEASNRTSPFGIQLYGEATGVATGSPFINIQSPADGVTLDFGEIEVGNTLLGNVIWSNTGDETFLYQISQDFGTVFQYVAGGLNDSTEVDSTTILYWRYIPTTAGSFSDTIRITDNSTNPSNLTSPYSIVFTGTAVDEDANFVISTSGYYFGVQDTSDMDTLAVTVTNNRATALTLVITSNNSTQFGLLNSAGTSVSSINTSTYTTYTFYITAKPTDEMYYDATISIVHNGTNATTPYEFDVGVTGDVPAKIQVIPTNYHFGSVFLGDVATSNNIIAYNGGKESLTIDSIYLATNSVFTIADTLGKTLPKNLMTAGRFDKDTTWTFSNSAISNGKLTFTGGSLPSASCSLPSLKPNNAYLVVMDISDHAGTGDAMVVTLGSAVPTESQITLQASQYSNGKLAIAMLSGGSGTTFSITIFNGNKGTKIDNIVVSEYHATQVIFTPVSTASLNTDNLSYEHNGDNTNPFLVPITGYMTAGGLKVNGNITIGAGIKRGN